MKHINFKKIRYEKNLSQKEFAELLGISRSYLSDLENGNKNPSFNLLKRIDSISPIFLTNNDADSVSLEEE